jgi:hypothetical protein
MRPEGHLPLIRLLGTWPQHKGLVLSRTNQLGELSARVNPGIGVHQNADCDSPFASFEPF